MLKRYSVFSNIKMGNTKAFLTILRLHLCLLCQCEWMRTSAEPVWLWMMDGGGVALVGKLSMTCRGL